MHKLKRLLALTGATGLLGALAFVAPANAALKAQCVVDGGAKAGTTKNATPGGPAVKYVQVSGGKGTFAFTSVNIVCVDLTPNKQGQNPSTGSVTATGSFRNSTQVAPGVWADTPCGMGKVMGKITSVTTDNPKYNVLNGLKFAVEFAPPTVGMFYWHDPAKNVKVGGMVPKVGSDDGDPKYAGKTNPSGAKSYVYAGQIQLSPARPAGPGSKDEVGKVQVPPSDKCAKAFTVNGTVLVDKG
jgi:hypothetical protein